MIRSKSIEDRWRLKRLDAKTLDSMFRRRIENGANCPPLVSAAILQTAKEVFPLEPDDLARQRDVGCLRLLVVAAHEPAGKSLEECEKVAVTLTLDAGQEDFEVRKREEVTGLRRARILRMCDEARQQGGLLTYEDLAYRLLNCGVRTVVRDVEQMRRAGLVVPTRGQQQDIGPGQTHRVQAVRLYLEGLEPQQIARRLYHALSSIENYLTTFGRVVLLLGRGHCDDEIAFLIRRSTPLVAAYRALAQQFAHKASAQRRLREILDRLEPRDSSGKRAAAGKKRGTRR
jgi:Protein of unknown function (DUF1670)